MLAAGAIDMIDHAQQPGGLDDDPQFFTYLPRRGGGDRLERIDLAARQSPMTHFGRTFASDQEQRAIAQDGGAAADPRE